MSRNINKIKSKFRVLMSVCCLVAACTSAPVQEMSDARQAIQAAMEAGASRYSTTQMAEAKSLLQQAETALDQGAYKEARSKAISAKKKAIEARKDSLQNNGHPGWQPPTE